MYTEIDLMNKITTQHRCIPITMLLDAVLDGTTRSNQTQIAFETSKKVYLGFPPIFSMIERPCFVKRMIFGLCLKVRIRPKSV